MREPDVDILGAIEARVIILRICAVDVCLQRTPRRISRRVLETCRSGAGHQVDQLLVVPVPGERQAFDGLLADLGVDVRLVGLKCHRLRLHRDLLGDLADLEPQIGACHSVDRDNDVVLDQRAEARGRHLQRVRSGQHVANAIAPPRIRGFFVGLVCVPIGRRDGRVCNDPTGRIYDSADERAVQHLGIGRASKQSGYERQQGELLNKT